MTKFDLFNPSSWAPEMTNIEQQITNKALGHMGQLVGEIGSLHGELEKKLKEEIKDEDYNIARHLRNNYPKAYALMEVQISLPNGAMQEVIQKCDNILVLWSNGTDWRRHNWKTMIPLLSEIKPYLKKNDLFSNRSSAKDSLLKAEVSGNEAWKVYLNTQKLCDYYGKSQKMDSDYDDLNAD